MKRVKKRGTVRRKLTPEQKSQRRRSFLLRAVIYVALFAVMYLAIGGLYLLVSGINPFPPAEEKNTVTVKIELFAPGEGGYKNGKYNNYKITQETMKDGENVTYLKLSALEPFTSFTVTGSSTKRSYMFMESGEYATFTDGSTSVIVNGESVNMTLPAKIIKEEVYVPLAFISEEMMGVSVTFNEEKNAYYVRKTADELSYKKKDNSAIDKIPLTDELKDHIADLPVVIPPSGGDEPTIPVNPVVPADGPVFKADLSAYEKYMDPDTDDYLFLVNDDNKLSSSYKPSDLVDVTDTRKDGRDVVKLRKYAEMALQAMFIELRANGFKDVSVTSAYRSYGTQSWLYDNAVNNYMTKYGCTREEAKKMVTGTQEPGASEHQTGLCIDMHNLPAADQAFGDEPAAKWLAENAHHFGYILRYSKDKQDITGIKWEPWHFRYVGRYHATKMYESGLCLEEYMEKIG